MEVELLHEQDGQRTFVVVLKTGEEVINSLGNFAKNERISAAQISAIGALSELELNYFDWEKKEYQKTQIEEPADRDAEGVSKFGAETPMRRPAQPEEIAPAFVFLAAPSCSSYITGEILPIVGGYLGG
jgi:NAD(P)-dependent dehydrogenase (short-subunit alcohol dehydrogenase family)